MGKNTHLRRAARAGFSLVEVMVVVGIIFILAAASLPSITAYMRTYRIRGGARQAIDGLQRARQMALKKNARFGVVFFVLNKDRFGYFSEDLYNATTNQREFTRQDFTTAQTRGEAGMGALPSGIEFVVLTGSDHYARFDNLGRTCNPGASGCPAVISGGAPAVDSNGYIEAAGSDRVIQLRDVKYPGLDMRVVLGPGGRVKRQVKDGLGAWKDEN